jgi:hypothetical protein
LNKKSPSFKLKPTLKILSNDVLSKLQTNIIQTKNVDLMNKKYFQKLFIQIVRG